ncbi:MAG: FAD-dependent oxidoreductase [Bacilli bacterium]
MIGTKRCITNPIAGNESLLKNLPKHKAHIAVVGQEISSIFAALYTARSGYQVDFYHENSALDMTSILKKISPNEYLKFNQYLVNQLKEYRVTEFASHLPSAAELMAKKYALTIVGCGAKPIDPDIKGINSPNVFLAQDVFFGDIKPGENIVVLGTGEEACTCVKYLIRDRKKITIVSEDSEILHDMDGFPNPDFIHDLEKNAVDIYTSSKVAEIKNTEVIINTPKGVVKVRADQVIIAFGYKDGTALETDLIKLGYPSCNIISLKKKTTVGLRSFEGFKKALKAICRTDVD